MGWYFVTLVLSIEVQKEKLEHVKAGVRPRTLRTERARGGGPPACAASSLFAPPPRAPANNGAPPHHRPARTAGPAWPAGPGRRTWLWLPWRARGGPGAVRAGLGATELGS